MSSGTKSLALLSYASPGRPEFGRRIAVHAGAGTWDQDQSDRRSRKIMRNWGGTLPAGIEAARASTQSRTHALDTAS